MRRVRPVNFEILADYGMSSYSLTHFLLCVIGDPKPIIAWRKDGAVLRNGRKYSVLRSGELIIRHAQYNDSGAYECVARTNRERVETLSELVVRGKVQVKLTGQVKI